MPIRTEDFQSGGIGRAEAAWSGSGGPVCRTDLPRRRRLPPGRLRSLI